jgi:LmbE family N-acetylglucosaminyl deacetylase
MKLTPERVLVLAAHTDDAELGCGGTVCRLLEEGSEIHVASFTQINPSYPSWPLAIEFMKSMKCLGIPDEHQFISQFEMRELNAHRQELLDVMYGLKEHINPDLVLLPSLNDIHMDHYTVSQEGIRAFKNSTILSYELPWSNFDFKTQAFIKLKPHHVEKKIECLGAYNSQKDKAYMTPEFIKAAASMRGVLIGTQYAEAFETVRLIVDGFQGGME